jgi:GNAT superfamily N-acetyltransferase
MDISLRKARHNDFDKVVWVESLSTPNLSYVADVWNLFINDNDGDWSVVEVDGEVVACGKYTILPDGSAWLETLRVIPQRQGLGLGKRLYEHWISLSKEKKVNTFRMYTGVKNVVSKGLAERYGLVHAQTFNGVVKECDPKDTGHVPDFINIIEPAKAVETLMSLGSIWGDWMVMNRTFFRWSAELFGWLAKKRMVYKDDNSESIIVMGARFMEDKQLHIGLLHGDITKCLEFAELHGKLGGVKTIHCLYPYDKNEIENNLLGNGYKMEPSPFIVMERNF